ncbi:amidohydrolase [Agrococcus sp. HG114]|uniref:amidohydrolase n=1 Tax=Agrococcus sp. HG114 TaxID=2969757 RepID=UPI00215A9347|nr:amidohydrolase [Agrococcus sp. HG114]MCR8670949.1 amidohydrolase [Agrococcus sp. HG114]
MAAGGIFEGLQGQLEWQRSLYEHFHRHPELSLQEHATAERIEQELTELGLAPRRVGGTGVVAVLENGTGPTVLARADTDALPVTEATGLPYASETPGVMHACAHDMHIVALLGAARLLHEHRDAWSGTYIALFQPGEETAAGARAMLDDGLVAQLPRPDVALAQHVMATEAGVIGTTAGPVLSAGDSLRITVHGRGAHGSMPHNAVDPVVLAASIVLRLQGIVSREVPPGAFAVVTVGASNAGSKSNIIPDRAELLLNLRTYDARIRELVIGAIERIVRAECQASGCPREPELEYYDQFPLTANDAAVDRRVTDAFTAHFGADRVVRTDPVTASEDFSRIPDAFGVPYAYWFVGSTPREALAGGGPVPANHSPSFAPAVDPTLETATRAHAVAALAHFGTDARTDTEEQP